MAKQIVNFRKDVHLLVEGQPYLLALDRYSDIEISLSLDKEAIIVKRKPRGGYPINTIFINKPKQLQFDYENEA